MSEPRRDWAASWSETAPLEPLADEALDAATKRALARAWLADGLEEHASIAAFARFTMLMLSVGAPPELVVASQRASLDEVAHARDCFALAQRYGASPAGPGPFVVHDSIGPMSPADLAHAEDPDARRVLARLVRDEARHAELSWRFVAWAAAEECRGAPGAAGVVAAVTRAVHQAVQATRAMDVRPPVANVASWRAHGRVTCAEARRANEEAITQIVLPCLERLAASSGSERASERVRDYA